MFIYTVFLIDVNIRTYNTKSEENCKERWGTTDVSTDVFLDNTPLLLSRLDEDARIYFGVVPAGISCTVSMPISSVS